MARQQPIFTAPGVAPTYADEGLNQQISQQALANTALAGANLATLPAQVLDWALATIRGGAKVPEIIRQSGGQSPFDLATQGQGFNQEPITQTLARTVEQNVPERMFTPAMVNAITFGNRDNLLEAAGPMGPISEMAGQAVGAIGGTLALASKNPKLFTAFDTITDFATATPSQAIFNLAKTPMGMLGAGAGVGAASSVLPAADVYYNAETGQTNPQAAALTMGLGTGLGALIPGALMAPQLAKQGKQFVDDIVKGATGMIKQSDDMQVVKQIRQQQLERQQMEAFTKVAQEQMDSLPPPKVPEEYRVEKTFAKETPIGYEEVPDSRQILRDEMEADIGPVQKELDDLIVQKQELETNIPVMQKELESLPETIGKKFSVDPDNSIESSIAEVLSKSKIDNASYKYSADLDPKIARQYTTKKEGRGLDDIAQEIQASIDRGDGEVSGDVIEAIIDFTKKYKSPKDYYRQRAQAELDVKRQEIGESFTKAQQELKQLEQEIPGRQEYIANQQEQYKARDNTKLPVLREPEPPARFIASKEGIREIGADGIEVPVIKFDETAPKTGVQKDGTIVVKGKKPVDLKAKTADVTLRNEKGILNITPYKNSIKRTSKIIGNKLAVASSEGRQLTNAIKDELSSLKKIASKYQNDNVIMKAVSEATTIEKLQNNPNIPDDFKQAILAAQPGIKAQWSKIRSIKGLEDPGELEVYFPFRAKNPTGVKNEIAKSDEQLVFNIFEGAEDASGKFLNDKVDLINSRLEKNRQNFQRTPEVLKHYHSMPDAIDIWADQIGDQFTKAKLFDNDLSGSLFEDQLPRLLAQDPNLSVKEKHKMANLLADMFLGMEHRTSKAYQLYSNVVAGTTLTGLGTPVIQLTSVVSNAHRMGIPAAIDGVWRTLKSAGKLTKSFASRFNKMTSAEFNDVKKVEALNSLWRFIADPRRNIGEKVGLAYNKGVFKALEALDWVEKESTWQSSYSWLKGNVGKDRYKLFLKNDLEGAMSPEQLENITKNLQELKKNPDITQIEPDTMTAIDILGGQRLVVDMLDKNGLGLSKNEVARAVNQLYSYATKIGADEVDRTLGLFTQAVKEKDWGTARIAAENVASLGFIFIPGMMAMRMLVDETVEGVGDLMQGRNPLERMSEELQDFNPNEVVSPRNVAGYIKELASTVMPYQVRGFDAFNKLRSEDGAPDKTMGLINDVFPGSTTTAKTGVSALTKIAQGRPQDIYSAENNPQFQYMFPRLITQPLYKASETAKLKEQERLTKHSPVINAMNQVELLKKGAKLGVLNEKTVKDKIALKREIRKTEQYKEALRHGTADLVSAQENKRILKVLPIYRLEYRQQQLARFKRGEISEKEFQDLLQNGDKYIIEELSRATRQGKAI